MAPQFGDHRGQYGRERNAVSRSAGCVAYERIRARFFAYGFSNVSAVRFGRPGYTHVYFDKTARTCGCVPPDTSRPACRGRAVYLHKSFGVRFAALYDADLRSRTDEPKRHDAVAAFADRARAFHQLRST